MASPSAMDVVADATVKDVVALQPPSEDIILRAAMIITPGAYWEGPCPNRHQQLRVDRALAKARAVYALLTPVA